MISFSSLKIKANYFLSKKFLKKIEKGLCNFKKNGILFLE